MVPMVGFSINHTCLARKLCLHECPNSRFPFLSRQHFPFNRYAKTTPLLFNTLLSFFVLQKCLTFQINCFLHCKSSRSRCPIRRCLWSFYEHTQMSGTLETTYKHRQCFPFRIECSARRRFQWQIYTHVSFSIQSCVLESGVNPLHSVELDQS